MVIKSESVAATPTRLGVDTDDARPRPAPSQLDLIELPQRAPPEVAMAASCATP
jgi:hypothetical protein